VISSRFDLSACFQTKYGKGFYNYEPVDGTFHFK